MTVKRENSFSKEHNISQQAFIVRLISKGGQDVKNAFKHSVTLHFLGFDSDISVMK